MAFLSDIMTGWPLFAELFLQWLTLTFMLVGLAGLVIPIFPGIELIWLSAFIYALIEFFNGRMNIWHWLLFALISILMIIGSFIDNYIITKKLRETGTPWKSIGLSYTAGILSSLFLTPIAALFITPLVLYLVEYWRLRQAPKAFNSVKGWLVGSGWTFLWLVLIGLAMIGLWLLWAWHQ
jgi:uncharacterized protein